MWVPLSQIRKGLALHHCYPGAVVCPLLLVLGAVKTLICAALTCGPRCAAFLSF